MASLIFGIFGISLFRLGKKRGQGILVGIGVALMVYPYFIGNEILLWGIGALLTVVGYKLALA